MALNAAQKTLLRIDILASTDPIIIQALLDGNHGVIAKRYNENVVPDYWIFRNLVPSNEIRDAIDAQDIANITSADRGRAVDLLTIREERGFSGANARDRSAWDDIFSVAAGDNSQQAILVLWTRLATIAERVFALSTDTGATQATADTTSFQGPLTLDDVTKALNS